MRTDWRVCTSEDQFASWALSEDGAVIKRDSDDEALARLVGDSFIHSYLKSCID